MRTKLTIALVALLALAVAGGTYAASGKKKGHLIARHAVLKESASYLGITVKQLRTQLKAGRSLAQVADATSGKSSSGLLDDLVGAVKAKLDKRVAAGKLHADRETKLLAHVTKRLQRRLAHVRASH